MSGYDSSIFSKQFSQRTEDNLEYITQMVRDAKDGRKYANINDFVDTVNSSISYVTEVIKELRYNASTISNRNGNFGLRRNLFSSADKLESMANKLQCELEILSGNSLGRDALYEVTQLLNSLMGIAVLPYEMHKEYFKVIEEDNMQEGSGREGLSDRQKMLMNYREYDNLSRYIIKLYQEKKWFSSYRNDVINGMVNNKIVFGFLGHVRNATCHSGDNALSILPLSGGNIIDRVLFYDHLDDQEFAMKLTISELRELVARIAEFYENSHIGYLDKTENIMNVEKRVESLLRRHQG